jgi:hypothetical protein
MNRVLSDGVPETSLQWKTASGKTGGMLEPLIQKLIHNAMQLAEDVAHSGTGRAKAQIDTLWENFLKDAAKLGFSISAPDRYESNPGWWFITLPMLSAWSMGIEEQLARQMQRAFDDAKIVNVASDMDKIIEAAEKAASTYISRAYGPVHLKSTRDEDGFQITADGIPDQDDQFWIDLEEATEQAARQAAAHGVGVDVESDHRNGRLILNVNLTMG